MTEVISDVDRLVVILRQRLAERIKRSAAGKLDRQSAVQSTTSDEVGQLLSLEGVDERSIKRALVQRFLLDQFGPEIVNEPKFQALVDQVEGALGKNPATERLLVQLVEQLRHETQNPKPAGSV